MINEDAKHRGQLRPDSNGECTSCVGVEEGDRRVRETVQLQRYQRNEHPEADGCLEVYTVPSSRENLREEANLSALASEFLSQFGKASNTLRRFLTALGNSDWATRRGYDDWQVPSSGFRGPGPSPQLRLQGAPEPVEGPKLPGSDPLKLSEGEYW